MKRLISKLFYIRKKSKDENINSENIEDNLEKQPDDELNQKEVNVEDPVDLRQKEKNHYDDNNLEKEIIDERDFNFEDLKKYISDKLSQVNEVEKTITDLTEKNKLSDAQKMEILSILIDTYPIKTLSDTFISNPQHINHFDWIEISKTADLDEGFIEKYKTNVNWADIIERTKSRSKTRKLKISKDFIDRNRYLFQNVVGPNSYVGTKKDLLDDIIPMFPEKMNTFVDLFAGGFSVGINVNAKQVICNDIRSGVIDMYEYFSKKSEKDILEEIRNELERFNLIRDKNKPYEESYAEAYVGFQAIKEEYAKYRSPVHLFILQTTSFNNKLTFDKDGNFVEYIGWTKPNPGKKPTIREYSADKENKLISFIRKMQQKNVKFTSGGFESLDKDSLNEEDFVYCDPPYLATKYLYDGNWTEKEEVELLSLLESLDNPEIGGKKIKFGLSNVTDYPVPINEKIKDPNAGENIILKKWIEDHPEFKVVELKKEYNKMMKKDGKVGFIREIYVTNA